MGNQETNGSRDSDQFKVLLDSDTSGGAFSVIVESCPPNAGPPAHIHDREDEFFFPLEGEFEFYDGDAWTTLSSQGAYGRRGKVHTWRNTGSTNGKLLIVATGNSFDKFLQKFGKLPIPLPMKELAELGAEYGISYVPEEV